MALQSDPAKNTDKAVLLAVDIGLRTGLAAYDASGDLLVYASRHFASPGRLAKGLWAMLGTYPNLTHLVLEGGGHIASLWERTAWKKQIQVMRITAETWRPDLLTSRQRRSGREAKRTALVKAREIIARSTAKAPTSLRHDAAEAILIGHWAVTHLGWVQR
ncbi:hypothetical protein [Desulfoplanes formicivorans]|jgi:hypothetical protein|uniref:Uncharacterized protein n=1 Tax=Desulfoplanes formicivorans TaxID=1592317 RepID=A0A194AE11_9BACT|nr:hypothetical protein [Desulfoplanes formicivorans]GAU08317.1 hypothetical protein DPF_1023 [Desulfoplanes formicivorans]